MPKNKLKKIHVFYYAILREQSHCSQQRMVTNAQTARDLYFQLKEHYGFTLGPDILKVAVNDSFKSWDTVLKSEDTVVFIPPLAGG